MEPPRTKAAQTSPKLIIVSLLHFERKMGRGRTENVSEEMIEMRARSDLSANLSIHLSLLCRCSRRTSVSVLVTMINQPLIPHLSSIPFPRCLLTHGGSQLSTSSLWFCLHGFPQSQVKLHGFPQGDWLTNFWNLQIPLLCSYTAWLFKFSFKSWLRSSKGSGNHTSFRHTVGRNT